jgi:biotin carboxylase
MAGHTYPVILKPTNLMKSLFVSKNSSIAELKKNYEHMGTELPKYYKNLGFPLHKGILIEEFLVGSMHTVAGFASADGEPVLVEHVADCLTAQDIGVSDSFLFSRMLPSRLENTAQQQLLDTAATGMRALGLTSSPAHIEIMLTAQGPKIIEIGARLGGYRPRMYEYSYGIDLYRAAVSLSLGKTPQVQGDFRSCTAVIELFPNSEGRFSHLSHLEDVQKLASIKHLSIKCEVGDKIGPAQSGYRAPVVIILGSTDEKQLLADAELVRQSVHIITR